ncbi:MAG: hypothetical protein SWX82_16435, partial [Cyanobacteriota bacterium]|nr:hypothetical protein [Cyanobacteriota bacterium]
HGLWHGYRDSSGSGGVAHTDYGTDTRIAQGVGEVWEVWEGWEVWEDRESRRNNCSRDFSAPLTPNSHFLRVK